MKRFHINAMARRDLEAIQGFSIERWGRDQAAQTTRELRKAMHLLAENPQLGRERPEIHAPPARFWTVNQLFLNMYDPSATPVKIVRVLDGRRDLGLAIRGGA